MKLLVYKINNTPINELDYYNDSDLNGNLSYQHINDDENIPENYQDITSITNQNTFGWNLNHDYHFIKLRITEKCASIGQSNLTNSEKDIVIEYNAYDNDMDKMIYLMYVKGLSQQDAQMFLLNSWHEHFKKNLRCFKQRQSYTIKVVLMYIGRLDAEDLFETVQRLVQYYTESGRLGKNYNDGNDGIMDYIQSTYGFTGQGLEENNYTLSPGATQAMFKQHLTMILAEGNYHEN